MSHGDGVCHVVTECVTWCDGVCHMVTGCVIGSEERRGVEDCEGEVELCHMVTGPTPTLC